MSFVSLLNQQVTIYNKSSYDAYGREQFGSGTTVNCRVEVANKVKLLPNGETATIDAMAFTPPTTAVSIDDKITYDSNNYKVLNKEVVVGADGNTHHYELELAKWNQ